MENKMESVTLFRMTGPKMALPDFVRATGAGTALVMSMDKVWWGKVDGGQLQMHADEPSYRPERVFEVRIFDGAHEWRWLRDGDLGATAVVGESSLTDTRFVPTEAPAERNEERYLLWGTQAASKDGWCKLTEGRIGSFQVPLAESVYVDGRGIVALRVARYFGDQDDEGNYGVVEERMIGLEPATANRSV